MAETIITGENILNHVDDFIDIEKDDDDELNAKLNVRDTEATKWMQDKIEEWAENDKWVKGDGMPTTPDHKSSTQINLLWANYRNEVVLLSDQKPGLIAYPKPDISDDEEQDEQAKQVAINKANEAADKIEEQCRYLWESKLKMSKVMRKISWSLVKNQIGFLMPYWDYWKDDIGTIYVNPKRVKFNPGAETPDDAEYGIVDVPHNKKWYKQNYPDHWEQLQYSSAKKSDDYRDNEDTDTGALRKGQALLQMYLEAEIFIYRAKSNNGKDWIILDKGENPLYNFDYNIQKTKDDKFPSNNPNIFDVPKIPLVLFNLPEDENMYPETTTKKLIPIQKDINSGKRQINDNSKRANGKLLVDAETFSEDEAKKIDFTKTNQMGIRIKGLRDNPHAAQFVAPQPQSDAVAKNSDDSRQMLDRITGQYAESRGEFNPSNKTASGIRSLQQASQIPIRDLSRCVEEGVTDLGMWWLQLMKMFYTEAHYIRRLGEDDAREAIAFSAEDIPEGTTILVKEGSMMPRPEEVQEDMAIVLGEKQLVAPQTVLEKLKYPDAKKEAIRLANWNNGIVSDEPQEGQGEPQDEQLQLAMQENDQLLSGRPVNVNPDDDDQKHIAIHMQAADAPESKEPDVVKVLVPHIKEHEQRLGAEPEQ